MLSNDFWGKDITFALADNYNVFWGVFIASGAVVVLRPVRLIECKLTKSPLPWRPASALVL